MTDPNIRFKRKSTSCLVDGSRLAFHKKKEEETRKRRTQFGLLANPVDINTAINIAELSL